MFVCTALSRKNCCDEADVLQLQLLYNSTRYINKYSKLRKINVLFICAQILGYGISRIYIFISTNYKLYNHPVVHVVHVCVPCTTINYMFTILLFHPLPHAHHHPTNTTMQLSHNPTMLLLHVTATPSSHFITPTFLPQHGSKF
jgi:hypothetical protein